MRELSRGQRDALLFGAITGAMAVACGGTSLFWAIPAIAVACAIYTVVRRALPEGRSLAEYLPVWILVPELLFLILTAARTASHAAVCWQGSGVWPLFPMVLLALAAASTWQNVDGVGRCAVLLAMASALFYAPVLSAAALEQEKPLQAGKWTEGMPVLITALSGVCGLFLPAKKGGKRFWVGVGVFAALFLYCTAGKHGELPILAAVKGISLFGVLQRFEALAACIITIGLFCMLVLLASAGSEIVKQLGVAQIKGFAVIVPAASIVWWANEVNPTVLTAGATLFWGVIPLLTLPVVLKRVGRKRAKKDEKSS